MKSSVAIAIVTLLLAALVFAHGNEEHVMGTVTNISGNSITIKTKSKQSVTVNVSDQTTFEKSGSLAALRDLKVGDKVIIHAERQDNKLVAHQVRFGAMKSKNGKDMKGMDHSAHAGGESPKQ